MEKSMIIGREHVSTKNIALVEPYVPADNAAIKSSKTFKARVVLRDNSSILDEATPEEFAKQHGFRMIPKDGVAINPDRAAISFRVRTFVRKEAVNSAKTYLTDLCWRGPDRREWFRSLETEPGCGSGRGGRRA